MYEKEVDYVFKNLKVEWLTKFTMVFGTLWLFVESLSVFFDNINLIVEYHGPLIFLISLIISIAYSYRLVKPKVKIEKKFRASNTEICIKVGDLLTESGSISLTTSNYFDLKIHTQSSNSIKQQLIRKVFDENINTMNHQIEKSLETQGIDGEYDENKLSGKRIKYKIGTTAVLENESRKIFMVVLTQLINKNGIKSTESNVEAVSYQFMRQPF